MLKPTSKAATRVGVLKKTVIKTFGIYINSQMWWSLFKEVAGLQDCCKTYLLYSHLRFYFLDKTERNIANFP